MRQSLAHLFQTTTFRLGVVQASVVLAFVVLLLSYVYVATTGQLLQEAEAGAQAEFAALEGAYDGGGIRRLTQEVERRAGLESDLVYALWNENGVVIAGPLDVPPVEPSAEPTIVDIDINAEWDGQMRTRVRGVQQRLLGGPTLLVGTDLRLSQRISARLTQALFTVAILGLALAIASGLLAARQAARRAETLSRTTQDVMRGDLTRRAPVAGVGDEFDKLASDLNAMLDRLERLVHQTRTTGDAIAHDLRTPLTRARQRIEAALAQPPNTDRDRAALAAALEESNRLLATFAAVLRLGRLESESGWRMKPLALSTITESIADFYEPAAEEAGLTFSADIEPGLMGQGDPELLAQALSNLTENALKYTPTGGQVRISARPLGLDQVEVAVSDNGPGVPEADRERVLQRFVRLESARGTQGIGLGLSLVAAVARLHGGTLILRDGLAAGGQNRPGLTAALTLPRATPEQVAAE